MKDQIERAIDLVLEQGQNEFLDLLTRRGVNYTVRPDGIVDVDGNVIFLNINLTKIPIKFGIVNGSFACSHNQLTSLIGCPEEIGGSFDCSDNLLTSLEGCPEEVGGNFYCHYNQLTSLQGAPEKVKGYFDCSYNQLTSLEGSPKKVGKTFDCFHNQLTSLKGCPEEVGGIFHCDGNPVEFTKEDIELAKQGKAPLGLPLSFVLMKNKEKEVKNRHERSN